jgi:hypothetical protein
LSCCLCFLSDFALIPGWGYLLSRNRLDFEKHNIQQPEPFPNLQLDCHRFPASEETASNESLHICFGPSRVMYGEFSPYPT